LAASHETRVPHDISHIVAAHLPTRKSVMFGASAQPTELPRNRPRAAWYTNSLPSQSGKAGAQSVERAAGNGAVSKGTAEQGGALHVHVQGAARRALQDSAQKTCK
jgi:hypothetical protein